MYQKPAIRLHEPTNTFGMGDLIYILVLWSAELN